MRSPPPQRTPTFPDIPRHFPTFPDISRRCPTFPVTPDIPRRSGNVGLCREMPGSGVGVLIFIDLNYLKLGLKCSRPIFFTKLDFTVFHLASLMQKNLRNPTTSFWERLVMNRRQWIYKTNLQRLERSEKYNDGKYKNRRHRRTEGQTDVWGNG